MSHTHSSTNESDGQELERREKPASGNTRAERTILLDYLRVRLPDTRDTWDALKGWLGPMTARGMGWRGWYDQSALVLDGGLIAWCGDRERATIEGVLVDLPGRACACLGDRLEAFLAWACDAGKVTRCDWALDDHAGYLTRERILSAEAAGQVVTRWQSVTLIEDRHRGKCTGWTVTLGSRTAEAYARIYDKAAERRRKGEQVAGHWVRFELECKGAFADAIARAYLAEGAGAIVGQINRRVRFTGPNGADSNLRRAPMAAWWRAFIGSVRRGASLLCGEKREATIEALAAWLERQAGPALATVTLAEGGALDWLLDVLGRSRHRLRPKHYAALALAGV